MLCANSEKPQQNGIQTRNALLYRFQNHFAAHKPPLQDLSVQTVCGEDILLIIDLVFVYFLYSILIYNKSPTHISPPPGINACMFCPRIFCSDKYRSAPAMFDYKKNTNTRRMYHIYGSHMWDCLKNKPRPQATAWTPFKRFGCDCSR